MNIKELLSQGLYWTAFRQDKQKKSKFERICILLNLKCSLDLNLIFKISINNIEKSKYIPLAVIIAEISEYYAIKLLTQSSEIRINKKKLYIKIIQSHYRKRINLNIIESIQITADTPIKKLNIRLLKLNQSILSEQQPKINAAKNIVGHYISKQHRVLEPKNNPLVSIIIPAWNVEKYIEGCIRSLQKQTYSNVEIIVVDDASTDNTYNIAKNLASKDNRITVLRSEIRSGPYKAKNIGLSFAKGKYSTFLDGDDEADKNRIIVHLNVMQKNPSLVASTSNWIKLNDDGYVATRKVWPLIRLNVGSLFIEKDIVLSSIGFFHEIQHSADGEYLTRIIRSFGSDRCMSIKTPLTYGAQRTDSLTGSAEYGYLNTIANKDRTIYREEWETWHHQELSKNKKIYLGKSEPMGINTPINILVGEK